MVEAATVDNAVNRLWGEVNGKGKNKLGELLMEVRAEIRAKLATKKPVKPVKLKSGMAAEAVIAV